MRQCLKQINMTYSFEKLEVWNLSIALTAEVYKYTDEYPRREIFGVTNQLRRAVNSVSANIAEGSSRIGNRDRARFFEIAYSSLIEVLNFLIVSEKLGYLATANLIAIRLEVEELTNKLNAYYKKIPRLNIN